ncbi:zinc finger protein, partial [Clarias magur]
AYNNRLCRYKSPDRQIDRLSPVFQTPLDGMKATGAVKEEIAEASGVQIYSTPRCHTTADHRVSQSHNAAETSAIQTSQPEHWLPQRDNLPGTSAGTQDSVKLRAQSKKPESKTEHLAQPSLSQSEHMGSAPSSLSPTVTQQTGAAESVAIKQEVVVVLPPEWEELDRTRTGTTSTASRGSQVREELQHRDPLPAGSPEERRVVYPGPCAKESLSSQVTQQLRMLIKKQPKPAEHANALASSSSTVNMSHGHSLHKSPPLPKPPQALPQLPYAEERT